MKRYPLPDHKRFTFGIWAALLALLLLTRDAMYSMMVWDFYTCQFLSLGIIAVMGVTFLVINRKHLKEVFTDSRMLLIAVSLAVTILPMAAKQDYQLMYFSIILGMLFAVFLTYFLSLEAVARWYVVTMCILGVWSLLCAYVLRLFIDLDIVSPTPVTNGSGVLFYNFIFSIVPDTYVKTRNFGIFREPGVYQFFIILALYLHNYVLSWEEEKHYWIVNCILAVTMLSTFATGGMIEMGLMVLLLFFERKWYRNKWILLTFALFAVLAAVVGWYCFYTQNEMYWILLDMVAKFTRNPESVGSRLGSISLGLELFFHSPFIGEPVQTVLHSMVDYTASTLILYNIFGILGGTLNVVGWIALVWKKERKIIVNLVLLLILFMSFNTQNLTWNLFFWLFPAMALTERGIPFVRQLLHK